MGSVVLATRALAPWPGLGPNRAAAARGATLAAYSALVALAVVAPPAAAAAILMVILAADWSGVRSRLPLFRSTAWAWQSLAWLMVGALAYACIATAWAFSYSYASAPVAVWWVANLADLMVFYALACAPAAVIGMVVAAFTVANEPIMRITRRRAAELAVLAGLPPLGIGWMKLARTTSGWAAIGWLLAILAWLPIYTAVLLWVVAERPPFDGTTLSHTVATAVRFLSASALLIVLAFATRAERIKASASEADVPIEPRWPSAIGQLVARWPELRGRIAGMAVISLGWTLILSLAVTPWAQIASARGGTADFTEDAGLAGVLLASVPVLLVSARILATSLARIRAGEEGCLPAAAWRPAIGTVLLAVTVMLLTGAAMELVGKSVAVLAEGVCIGISLGLSTGIAHLQKLARSWLQVGSIVVSVVFWAMLVTYAATVGDQQWQHHPENWPTLKWYGATLAGVFCILGGFWFGDRVLIRGFLAFAESVVVLEGLFWRVVGYASGYVVIAFAFAAVFFGAYEYDQVRVVGPNSTAKCGGAGAVHFVLTADSTRNLCRLDFGDFLYFSVNTIAPLGYSDIRPRLGDGFAQLLTTVELTSGILWTVVVFGAVMTRAGRGDRPASVARPAIAESVPVAAPAKNGKKHQRGQPSNGSARKRPGGRPTGSEATAEEAKVHSGGGVQPGDDAERAGS